MLILGAGLTGVKCAEGIRGLCAQIAIADLAPRVLPAVLDDTAAAMVQARMEEKGVRFYLNDSAAAFRGNTARLQSGTELEFDVLVCGRTRSWWRTQAVRWTGASWWTAAVPPRFPMYMLRETVPRDTTR